MAAGFGSAGLGLLAGILSTLSPCVLPIVPILLSSALNAHRHAPLALAGGLAVSYSIVGTGLAWAGGALGVDTAIFRDIGAVVLGALGVVLMSAGLQQRFAALTSGIGDAGNGLLSRLRLEGLMGQLGVGLVLGVVWSPCVGPTLGAAVVLASQGHNLARAATTMAAFGVGAATPLVLLAYASRSAMSRNRSRLLNAGKAGKLALGVVMLLLAIMILSGADKFIEAWLVDHSPDWLTQLTTHF